MSEDSSASPVHEIKSAGKGEQSACVKRRLFDPKHSEESLSDHSEDYTNHPLPSPSPSPPPPPPPKRTPKPATPQRDRYGFFPNDFFRREDFAFTDRSKNAISARRLAFLTSSDPSKKRRKAKLMAHPRRHSEGIRTQSAHSASLIVDAEEPWGGPGPSGLTYVAPMPLPNGTKIPDPFLEAGDHNVNDDKTREELVGPQDGRPAKRRCLRGQNGL